jgi:hypothetical protein
MKAIVVHALLLSGKQFCLLSFAVCRLHLYDVLILFRLFGRLYAFLSGQMPSYHIVRRQGVLYSCLPESIL